MLNEVLAERVVKHKKRYPPINKGIALATLALVALCLLTLLLLLLIFQPPPDTYSYRIYHFGPEDDVQESLKHCAKWRDITEYGDAGRFVGSSLAYGDLYVRERIHPDDIPKRVLKMRCGPPASIASATMYYSFGGASARTEDVANVCMEPLPGAADGFWGPGKAKDLLRKAPIYFVDTSDTLPNTCEMIQGEMRAAYGQLDTKKNDDPVIIGTQCFMHGPTDLIGLQVPVNQIELYFGWPLQRGRGLVRMEIWQYCTQFDRSTDRFMEELSSQMGDMDIEEMRGYLMGWGIPIPVTLDPPSEWLSSLHARDFGYGDQLVVTRVDGPYLDTTDIAPILGYDIPEGYSSDDQKQPYWTGTATVSAFTRSSLKVNMGFQGASRLCKNTTVQFTERLGKLEEILKGVLAMYKQMKFTYECAEMNEPDPMTRLSYIWPMLSMAYTIVGIYIAKALYMSMFQAGRRCCGAQAMEVHKDDGSASQGTSSVGVASQEISKKIDDDDDDDRYDELEARIGSRIGSLEEGLKSLKATNQAQEAHIRNLEDALESTRSGMLASLADVKTAQRGAEVVPMGDSAIAVKLSQQHIEDLDHRLEKLVAKRTSLKSLSALDASHVKIKEIDAS